jgi:ABC-type siderophore export system fused ATPase/permease subunit
MRFFHTAYISMQRINAFFAEEEVSTWASSLTASAFPRDPTPKRVGFSNATFEWHASRPNLPDSLLHFRLGPLDLDFPLGKLSLVTGATGSGKSALLVALLGGTLEILIFTGSRTHVANAFTRNILRGG